jgi:transposase-like protein
MQTTEIQKITSDYKQSGKTVLEFCSERGITVNQFYSWQRKLRRLRESGSTVRPARFSKVETQPLLSDNEQVIRVDVLSGVTLHVPVTSLGQVLVQLRDLNLTPKQELVV